MTKAQSKRRIGSKQSQKLKDERISRKDVETVSNTENEKKTQSLEIAHSLSKTEVHDNLSLSKNL
jgi:hypothetical protein